MNRLTYISLNNRAAFDSANAFLELTDLRGAAFVQAYVETFWRMGNPPRRWMNSLKYGVHARDSIV